MYTSFIEAPGEKSTSSTGIGIGAGTGFSSAGEVSIVANNNVAAVVFKQSQVVPSSDGGYDLGTSALKFGTVYANAVSSIASSAKYADLAENYLADAEYEEGTVVVFGGEQEVTLAHTKGDRRIAGVISAHPAYLMNSELEGEFIGTIALQGRVPVKVLGKVHKGDLLVTSAIPGYAIVDNDPKVGTVIGKAVANKTTDDRGTVEVVVGRV